jgi:hypothetical protein
LKVARLCDVSMPEMHTQGARHIAGCSYTSTAVHVMFLAPYGLV